MAQLQSGTRIHGNAIIDTTLDVRGTNPSTDTLSGAITIAGGAGVVGNINAGGNITGNYIIGNYLTGTLTTAAQPNITSTGTLTSLSVTGNVTSGNLNTGNISASGNLYANNANFAGVVFAGGDLSTTGNLNANNANFGGVVFAGGDVSTAGNVSAVNANFSGFVFAQGNVTSGGNFSTTGNIFANNANFGGFVFATGNITSAGNLSTTGNLYANNANFNGVVFAEGNITTAGNLSTTGNLYANNANFNGVVFANGNITTGGNFSASGNLYANNANFNGVVFAEGNITTNGNLSTAGNITANNANFNGVVFANGNITTGGNFYGAYTELSTLTVTGNIRGGNLSTSGKLDAGDATITGNLTVHGNTIYADVTTVRVKDPIIEQGGNTDGTALTTNDGKDRGQILHYFTSTNVDAFMGWDNSNAEFALGSDVTATNEVITFNSYGNLRVDRIIGNGALITSINGANVTGQVANALVSGTVYTAAQPNITSTGTLTSLTVGSGGLNVQSTTDSTATTNGAIKTAGGVGIAKTLNVGANAVINENLYVGPGASGTAFVNPTIIAKDTAANYIQAALVNSSESGSSDWVAYADNGTDTGGWADFGFTSSNFSDPTYTITGPSDGYFFVQSLAGSYGGNLVIATGDQGTKNDIIFATGGFDVADEFGRIDHGLQTFHIKATTVSTTTSTGALRVAGGTGIAGNLRVGSGIFGSSTISAAANVTGGNILTAGLISATGNVTGNYIIGNGSTLTNIAGGNVTGQVANALVAGTVYTAAQPNITSLGTLTSLSVTGNTNVGNLNTAGIVSATGNANVGNVFVAGTGVVSTAGTITGGNIAVGSGFISTTGNANVGNLLTNNLLYANGTAWSLGGGSYGNSNVATYLASFGSNAISTTGTVTTGALRTNGLLSATGNIQAKGETQLWFTSYTDPDSMEIRALKIGDSGMAVLGGIKTDTLIARYQMSLSQSLGTVSGSTAIDLNSGSYVQATTGGSTTWSFTNVPASNAVGVVLELTNGGSAAQTWGTIKWPGGVAPTLTSSGVDVLVFVTDDGGTTWRGVLSMTDSK